MYKATVRDKKYISSTEVSLKTRWQQHKYSILKKLQATALAFTTSNNTELSEIKWQMLFLINCSVPRKADNCSICNLERMAIAEANRVKHIIQEKN